MRLSRVQCSLVLSSVCGSARVRRRYARAGQGLVREAPALRRATRAHGARTACSTSTLTSAPGDLDVSGYVVRGEAYNGTFVGPTLRLEPGDEIRSRSTTSSTNTPTSTSTASS